MGKLFAWFAAIVIFGGIWLASYLSITTANTMISEYLPVGWQYNLGFAILAVAALLLWERVQQLERSVERLTTNLAALRKLVK